jgi:hypothetical protein
VRRNGFKNRENGAQPAAEANGSPKTEDLGQELRATGQHAAAASVLRILRLRARREAVEPGGRVLTRRQVIRLSSWEDLQHEVDRSRRYGHSFSVVRLASRTRLRARSNGAGEARRAELERKALMVGVLLRKLDRVWADGEDIYLLLPEGGRAMAESMLDRISEPLGMLVPDSVAAIATFPQDGLSIGGLLAALGRPSRPLRVLDGGASGNGANGNGASPAHNGEGEPPPDEAG